jgi:hypothetical protein
MLSGVDHLVIAVHDLDAAVAEVREGIGLAFTAGGRHDGLGTSNRIAFLGDAYLELITVDDVVAAQGWAIGEAASSVLERGGGFATWALADPSIRTTVACLRANGSHIGPVTHGSRERPDGERVEWWTASPPHLGPELPPLLIKHVEAGVEWGAEARAAKAAFVHPIGSPVALDGLDLAVGDPLGLAATCRTEVGLDFAWDGASAVAAVGRQVVRLADGASTKATIRIAATVDAERSAELLGVRFVVRPGMTR